MDVKGLLKLLQKVENKDINLKYTGIYGYTFPITEITTKFNTIELITGSTGILPIRKLVKYLLDVNKNYTVEIKLENSNYRCIQDVLSSGSIKILPIVVFEVNTIRDPVRKCICSNCAHLRCQPICTTAIRQYCDKFGYKLL